MTYDDVLKAAHDNGILIVAVADNYGQHAYSFPAAFDEAMSVAANDWDEKKDFSLWNNQVEISGPGVETKSTMPNNGYGYKSGTSMASPHVAGVAPLM